MDTDLILLRKIKKAVKAVKYRYDYRDISILPENEGNNLIYARICEGKPLMVARGGAVEMRCIGEYLHRNDFSKRISNEISICAGVFPNDNESLQKFCELYITNFSEADIVSLWGVGAEAEVVHSKSGNSIFTELHALEPYYFANPWTAGLENKKVLVIHPFSESIIKQYSKRDKIFENKKILPKFQSLICIKAVQSSAGEKTDFDTWFEALNFMKSQISEIDFDIAIIGAGAYGLPLASYCKSIDKQAVQMSGATQILFGIKGRRWDKHPIISKLYNDAWVRPDAKETPNSKEKVEGGSYW